MADQVGVGPPAIEDVVLWRDGMRATVTFVHASLRDEVLQKVKKTQNKMYVFCLAFVFALF